MSSAGILSAPRLLCLSNLHKAINSEKVSDAIPSKSSVIRFPAIIFKYRSVENSLYRPSLFLAKKRFLEACLQDVFVVTYWCHRFLA